MSALGTLFVVATPIGNLGDLTARAIETLRTCDRVLAEDTRRTRQLLSHLGITGKPIDRLDAHAGERDVARARGAAGAGERVALVTDAGTPGVSDPGEALVTAAIAAGVRGGADPGRERGARGARGERPRGRRTVPLRRLPAARRRAEARGDRARVRDAGGGRALRVSEPRAGARSASSPTRRPSAARASRAS